MKCVKTLSHCNTCDNFKSLKDRKNQKERNASPCNKIALYQDWIKFGNATSLPCRNYKYTTKNCISCNLKYNCLTNWNNLYDK